MDLPHAPTDPHPPSSHTSPRAPRTTRGGQTSPCSRVPEEKTRLLGSGAPQGHAAEAGEVWCESQAPEPDSSVTGGCPHNNPQPPWCLSAGLSWGTVEAGPLLCTWERVSLATGGVGESGEPALPLAFLVCYPTEGLAPGPQSGDMNTLHHLPRPNPPGPWGRRRWPRLQNSSLYLLGHIRTSPAQGGVPLRDACSQSPQTHWLRISRHRVQQTHPTSL